MRLFWIVSSIFLSLLSASAAPYADPRHHQQGRPRFSTVIPPDWTFQPEEGRYISPDGSSWFAASASPVGSESLPAHMNRFARQQGERVTYFRREPDWIAVSGFKGTRIFYRKAVVACGGKVWHHVEFEYPADRKRLMDPFVSRASYAVDHAETSDCVEGR
jgi:serine/threonine-protein kinase